MPSNAFKYTVKQLDPDTIQYLIWSYEDGINAGEFSGENIDKVMDIIQFLKSCLGEPDTIDYVLSKMPICLN